MLRLSHVIPRKGNHWHDWYVGSEHTCTRHINIPDITTFVRYIATIYIETSSFKMALCTQYPLHTHRYHSVPLLSCPHFLLLISHHTLVVEPTKPRSKSWCNIELTRLNSTHIENRCLLEDYYPKLQPDLKRAMPRMNIS